MHSCLESPVYIKATVSPRRITRNIYLPETLIPIPSINTVQLMLNGETISRSQAIITRGYIYASDGLKIYGHRPVLASRRWNPRYILPYVIHKGKLFLRLVSSVQKTSYIDAQEEEKEAGTYINARGLFRRIYTHRIRVQIQSRPSCVETRVGNRKQSTTAILRKTFFRSATFDFASAFFRREREFSVWLYRNITHWFRS